MNKIDTFSNFLATNSAQFSIWNYMLNLLLTALLSYLLGLLYNHYGNSLSNRKSFSNNFVLLAVTTMIIITIVKSSLALSLGLVGALSIVRFRAAIKEPEELTYLFLNIAIGLGFGADQKMATLIGFVFIALFLFFGKRIIKNKNQDYQNLIISVSILNPQENLLDEIAEILKKYCEKINLKRFDENDTSLESSFIIEVENFKKINDAKNELKKRFNKINISFIDNNLII